MSIVDAANMERDAREIKRALEDIGCPVCEGDTIKDIPDIIRKKCHHGPQHVFNAVIEGGPGIKARLINGKGYKISATDKAELTQDISEDLCAGNSVGKALFYIVNKLIPKAAKEAALSPYIVDIEFVKTSYAGDDVYCNRFFGEKGRGRKTGLRQDEWYLKIYVVSQIEPIYVCAGAMIADIKEDIMNDTHRMCDNMIRRALKDHGFDCKPSKPERPHHPCHDHKDPRPHILSCEDIDKLWHHFDGKYEEDCDCDCCQDDEILIPDDLDEGFAFGGVRPGIEDMEYPTKF